jgi:short-subunit dehydrogenase
MILGGRSEIGLAIARRFSKEGTSVVLAARTIEGLEQSAEDIPTTPLVLHRFDVLAIDQHKAFLDALGELPEVVVCAVGLYGKQVELSADAVVARRVMETNYLAPSLLLEEIAGRMEARNHGTIIGLSSVAGDRGRASNYTYGSAKAGFTGFLSGLRARLSRTAVQVITVKPGFVATRMTAGMKLPRILTAAPEGVADATFRAFRKKRNVIYVRPIWRLLMILIRLLPEPIFQKLRI